MFWLVGIKNGIFMGDILLIKIIIWCLDIVITWFLYISCKVMTQWHCWIYHWWITCKKLTTLFFSHSLGQNLGTHNYFWFHSFGSHLVSIALLILKTQQCIKMKSYPNVSWDKAMTATYCAFLWNQIIDVQTDHELHYSLFSHYFFSYCPHKR